MTTNEDFFQAADPFFQHYNRGDYSGALEIAEDLVVRYPEQAVHTYLWRICLTSRLKRIDEALQLFAEGLDAGYWWSEGGLHKDPDLAPLQGLPKFEQLVAASHARHMAAQAGVQPDLRVYTPDSTVPLPYPLLIALHGGGHSLENDNAPYWKHACQLGWLVAVPRSSQLSWPGAYGWDDSKLAGKEIVAHYDTLCAQYPVDRQRLIIAGMSQGGALAIHLVLGRKLPACGFLAVVPGNRVMEGLEPLVQSVQGSGLRGYMVAGGKDPRYEMFKQIHALFLQHGIPCEMEDHPELGHEFPPDFDNSLEKSLNFILA
jgi:predicted esterase